MRVLNSARTLGPATRSGGADRFEAESGGRPGRAAGPQWRRDRPGCVGGRAGRSKVRGGGGDQPDAPGARRRVGCARFFVLRAASPLGRGRVLQASRPPASLVVTKTGKKVCGSGPQAVRRREFGPRQINTKFSVVRHPRFPPGLESFRQFRIALCPGFRHWRRASWTRAWLLVGRRSGV